MAKSPGGRSFLATFGLIFVSIAVLFAADTFLAKTERAESRVEAARRFNEGQRLMQSGRYSEAISRISDALVIERENRGYRLALARAQLAADKFADAETTIARLLQDDSTDGSANLTMARVLVKEGRFDEAFSYYHRAIFGEWGQDAKGNRLRARFELIDLLAQRDAKEELLAELLPVQDQAPRDLKTRLRLGDLFLAAGSSQRAGDVFRSILREQPANPDAHQGLGEAEFTRGSYRAARIEYLAVLRSKPVDQTARKRLDTCNQVLGLDPTIRGLGPGERLHRSLKLVQLSVDETSQCIGASPSPELRALLDTAAKVLKAKVKTAGQSDVSESNLDLAEKLWQARKKECKSLPAADSPLALVQARIAQ